MKNKKPLCFKSLMFIMLLAVMLAASWGWLIQPSPYLNGIIALSPTQLSYARNDFIKALSGDFDSQQKFLKWRQNQGAFIDFNKLDGIEEAQSTPTIFTQSSAAASICLALCQNDQILAIPSFIRSQDSWHNSKLLESIPYTTEKVDTELLCNIAPERCIASHFSSPHAIERFATLGLPTLILPAPNHIEALETSIKQTADFTGRKKEGQWLLATFKQAIQWLESELPQREFIEENVLIIELYRQMSLPSHKQLYMKWLHPHASEMRELSSPWSTPIDYESLYTLKPKLVILLCENVKQATRDLAQDPKWQTLVHETGLQYTLVSLECVNSPSQIFAIGLYDIVAALKSLDLKKEPSK